jgi:hypothetical protein
MIKVMDDQVKAQIAYLDSFERIFINQLWESALAARDNAQKALEQSTPCR